MIDINLIPTKIILRRRRYLNQIRTLSASILVFICVLVCIKIYQQISLDNLKEEVGKIELEKNNFSKIIADIKKIDEEKKILATRIAAIQELQQSSPLTVHVLDEVAKLTPPYRMWLKSLAQNGNQLTLVGMALDDQTIASYMDELEASGYIHNVQLASSSQEAFAERSLKAFSITAHVDMPKQ